MRKPRSIYWFSAVLGERTVPVYLTDRLRKDVRGNTKVTPGCGLRIDILAGQSREEQDETLLHELCHAVLWPLQLPLAQEERFVGELAQPLLRALVGMGFRIPARPYDFPP